MLKDLLNQKEAIHIKNLSREQVRELQGALRHLGYSIDVDGIVGPKTTETFNKFKKDNRLTNPDYIGETTVDYFLKILSGKDLVEEDTDRSPKQPSFTKAQTPATKIDWYDFDCPVSKFFTVGEVTQWQTARIPTGKDVQSNILRLAKELDEIRIDWGSAIGVTSWYRPPAINKQVGGVWNSMHLFGHAVDIYSIGKDVVKFEKWLDDRWFGAMGYGATYRNFVHLDLRNGKGFKDSLPKATRWLY